jgi:hypothetical protein
MLFYGYPGNLLVILQGILTYRVEIGPLLPILLNIYKNHLSLYDNKDLIFKKIVIDLALGRIQATNFVVTSPLGLVPKANGGFYYIYNLFSPKGFLVNNFIDLAWAVLHYTQIEIILIYIITAGRGCYLVK